MDYTLYKDLYFDLKNFNDEELKNTLPKIRFLGRKNMQQRNDAI